MPFNLPGPFEVLVVLAAALPLAIAVAPAATAQERPLAERPLPVIRVNGEGSVAVRPDMATVTLGVVREADTARAALDANNQAMAEVTQALKAAGIEAKDLQTSNFRIDPRYVYPPQRQDGQQDAPRIVGYTVSNQLTVRIRDLAKVGEILDRAVTLGVNADGGISFGNADPKAVVAAARKEAVRDAAERALTLADAAGVRLGAVMEIVESGGQPRPMPMSRGKIAMAAEAAVPVEAGENEYTVNVQVTFEIAN